ncbi:preprotein translocase subunit SecA [Neorickettsia sennetsu]|uniref:Protein translocase subunit SecA n=1 Tax=Ehrlichia sennetsu (strain ATCC VR-367 / Miyayama) TaxID=222891 RepID=SECA_EHRS3|nr:preprotein translocase subunit SecA [Neorickettsia sennetsu]Q2GEH0.1 RecName: Full=Protein translocase subunit SecA [Neorickettsia sennetsu str. Miyayama]ABD46321.1 preprotein translocase, SecA subunit [Neorickettsia sennetsu str. Miyayama]
MLDLVHKIFDSRNRKIKRKLKDGLEQVNSLETRIRDLSSDELRNKTSEFKERLFKQSASLDEILPEAYACVREASLRTLGMRHFDVQIMGGIVLHWGMISEMHTGEGKTLVATLAAYLNALSEKGVHVVTVNDYLARRDTEWMKQIYRHLGLQVSCITSDMRDPERAHAYKADITYATNNELGFDYLRDNMKFSKGEMVQRDLHYAIVDEVDSILIDEARTPLIISGVTDNASYLYASMNKLAEKLDSTLYIVDEKTRTVSLTEEGQEAIEKLLMAEKFIESGSSLYEPQNLQLVHCLNQSLKAINLFQKNKDYIVQDGQIVLIDEFTGRMMHGRRYSEGLHQALEAKENLKIQNENQTLASITFQNYFRMYGKLSGMTGTAATEREEFSTIYGLEVVQIPSHLPVRRVDHDDEIYASKKEKYEAILALAKECHEKLQPILIGTTSIENSEELSRELKKAKLKHSVLNAKQHAFEAEIIAQAGKPGAITIATNMAGRGTDIQLGGNINFNISANDEAEKEHAKNEEIVRKAGGLYVIGTERHESRRIDNQLRGRSGRQGDPGESKFFLSLDDDLLRVFGTSGIRNMLKKQLSNNGAIKHSYITRSLEKAQKKVESRNYEIRKNLIKFDDVINEQRKVIFSQRNNIMESGDIDLLPIVTEVNAKTLENARSKNFYDISTLIHSMQSIYNEDFKELHKTEDIDGFIDSKTKSIIAEKERAHVEFLLEIKKRIMIAILDQLWKEHLQFLENLRLSINLKAVAQKNPLIEFKHEAFQAFQRLSERWHENIIASFVRVKLVERMHMKVM